MKIRLIVFSALFMGIFAWRWAMRTDGGAEQKKAPPRNDLTIVSEQEAQEKAQAATAPFFKQYGTEHQSPGDDLANVTEALEHFWLLIKDPDALSVMSNASIMNSLKGENPHGLRFISPTHPLLNEQGELLDRWNTPLQFHAKSMTQIEIRSAGPDQKLYTEDDVVSPGEPTKS